MAVPPYPSFKPLPLWQKYLAFMPAYFVVLSIWYGANTQDNITNFVLLGMVIFMFWYIHHYQKNRDQEYDEAVSNWKHQAKSAPEDTSFGESFR